MMFDERGKNIYRLLNTDIDAEFNNHLKVGRNVLKAKLPTEFLFSGRYDLIFDASYHNSSWISCPYHDITRMVSFNKVNTNFSTLLRREAVVAPAVEWQIIK